MRGSRGVARLSFCLASVALGMPTIPAHAMPTFTDITASAGIDYVQWDGIPKAPPGYSSSFYGDELWQSGGAAAGDFDRDGLVDLYVTRQFQSPILYRNTGQGTFVDVTAQAGLTFNNSSAGTNGAAWGDIDNDGDLDLYVTALHSYRYYLYTNNGNGTFSEEAVARGADLTNTVSRSGQSVAFGDYDRDGYLDIAAAEWLRRRSSSQFNSQSGLRLLKNQGGANAGKFTDTTASAGLVIPGDPTSASKPPVSFTPRFADMDRDGKTDMIVTSDFGTSQLFWGKGDGTFQNGTLAAGVGTETSGMGSTVADYDRDGLLDWFVTSIDYGTTSSSEGNRLYRNRGDRTFSDRTSAGGVRKGDWGWGTAFLDFDNDTLADIVMTNGSQLFGFVDQMKLWRNAGNGSFTDVSAAAGVNDGRFGTGLLTFDFDNDGDLDIYVVNNAGKPLLLRNDGGNLNDWLRVKTVGRESNRDGIGAFITLTDASLSKPIVLEMDGGSNYLSQSEMIAHFGLGDFTGTIDRVSILWPSGRMQDFFDVSPNQVLLADEGSVIPEPATIVLLGAVLAAGALRRR